MAEEIKHPSRYCRNGIEVWEVEKAFAAKPENNVTPFIEHLRFGALEYILRCWEKNGVADLEKAAFLLQRAVEEVRRFGNSTCGEVAEPTSDGDDEKSFNETAEKMHPLQNTITPNINDVCFEICMFVEEHHGKKPTVVLVSGKVYNALKAEIIRNSAQFGPTDNPDDNTTYIMGVRVVNTESTRNHKDMEAL